MNFSTDKSDMTSYQTASLLYRGNYNDTATNYQLYLKNQLPQLLWSNLQLKKAVVHLRPYYLPDPDCKPTQAELSEAAQSSEIFYQRRHIYMADASFSTEAAFMAEKRTNEELLRLMSAIKESLKRRIVNLNEQMKDFPAEDPNDPRPFLIRMTLYAEYNLEKYSCVKECFPLVNHSSYSQTHQAVRIPVVGQAAPRKRRLVEEIMEGQVMDTDGPSPGKRRKLNWEWVGFPASDVLSVNDDDSVKDLCDGGYFADDEEEHIVASEPRDKLYRKRRHSHRR